MAKSNNHRQVTFNFRSFVFLISIYVAFFASGAASLIAEVTWNRMLIVVVGNSMSATAMIIVVFMGGLGLGSYVGGKIFRKRAPSLVPYLLLEIAASRRPCSSCCPTSSRHWQKALTIEPP